MNDDRKVTLYHSPNTRSSGALTLLEELGVPYELHVLNMKAGEQREPKYLAVNPMGKVPALKHGDALITEQVAIFLYLADLFPEAKLAPPIGDPLRGPYLRWMIFYAACFEPAVIDGATHRDPAPQPMSPYGDFETMFRTLTDPPRGLILSESDSPPPMSCGVGLSPGPRCSSWCPSCP